MPVPSIILSHKSQPNAAQTVTRLHCSLTYTLICTAQVNLCSPYIASHTAHTYSTSNPSCSFPPLKWTGLQQWHVWLNKANAAMGWWDKPLSPASEQVRKAVSVPDYTMSCRATNPTLVIHPVLCADLLTNGQMPMIHFLVAFLPVSFAASSIAG